MATKRKKTQPSRAEVIRKCPALKKASSGKQQFTSTSSSTKTTRHHSGRQVSSVKCEDDHKKQQAVSRNSPKSTNARLLVNAAATKVDKHTASLKDKPTDAYEFSETDEFITSSQSTSNSNSKKSKTATSTKSITKILTSKKTAKSGMKVLVNVGSGEERKQTSTPVGSQTQRDASKAARVDPILGKRRSPRAPPALLDISVTPILPVPASLSPKRRRQNDYDSQNGSYMASLLPKTSAPADFGKPKRQAPRSKQRQPAQIPVSTPTTVASSAKLKRKRPDVTTQSLDYDHSDSGTNSAPPKQKAHIISEKETPTQNIKFQSHTVSQSKPPKQKTEKLTKQTGSKPSSAPKRTTTAKSTKVSQKKIPVPLSDDELKDLWGPENEEMYCLSVSKDSGISFGSDGSRSAASPEVGSLPGFMEEDVLLGAPPDMSFSPPPAASSTQNSKDPVSSLNRSMTKSYKANGKLKKRKGRPPVSRLDAWASEVNQVMEAAESFELVIEG